MPKENLNIQEDKSQALCADNAWRFIEPHVNEHSQTTNFRLTQEGRKQITQYWEELTEDKVEPDLLRESISKNMNKLEPETYHQKHFLRLAKTSLEGRVSYIERVHFLEETKATNSPWNKVVESVKSKLYPEKPEKFVENFTSAWILSKKKEIAQTLKEVDTTLDKEYLRTAVENKFTEKFSLFTESESAQGKSLKEISKEMLKGNSFIQIAQDVAKEQEEKIKNTKEIRAESIEKTSSWKALTENATKKLSQYKKILIDKLPSSKARMKAAYVLITAAGVLATPQQYINDSIKHINEYLNSLENVKIRLSLDGIDIYNAVDQNIDNNTLSNAESSSVTTTHQTPLPEEFVFDENNLEENLQDSQTFSESNEVDYLDGLVNPNFRSGPLSLEENFSITLDEETAKLSGYSDRVTFDLEVNPVQEQRIDGSRFERYQENSNLVYIIRSDKSDINFIYGHSFTDGRNRLPFDWVRTLYEDHKDQMEGATFSILQVQDEQAVNVEYKITSAVEIPVQNEYEADFIPTNDTDPIYYSLEKMGVEEDARRKDSINFIVCSGKRINGGWDQRIIVSAIPTASEGVDVANDDLESSLPVSQEVQSNETQKSWAEIRNTTTDPDRLTSTEFRVSSGSYTPEEYSSSLEHNMVTASEMVQNYSQNSPISQENKHFSFDEAVNFFEDKDWESVGLPGAGACKVATLLNRAIYDFVENLDVEPEFIETDKYGHDIVDIDLLTIRKVNHPENGTVMPKDELMIRTWDRETLGNSNYEITLNERLRNGYPIPNDLKIWFEIKEDERGYFQTQLMSNYQLDYLRQLLQKQDITELLSASSG